MTSFIRSAIDFSDLPPIYCTEHQPAAWCGPCLEQFAQVASMALATTGPEPVEERTAAVGDF